MRVSKASGQAARALSIFVGFALAAILSPATALAATSVVSTLPGNNPFGTAVNPNTNRIYVSDAMGMVRVIDGDSNTEIATVAVSLSCRGIAVNPNTNKIYAAGYLNGTGNKVHVIDGATNTLLPDITLPAGSGPAWIGVNPGLNRIYVGNESTFSVSVIDGGTDTVITTVPAAGAPRGVGVHTGTGNVYVATAANAITVFSSGGGIVATIGPAGINGPMDVVVDSVANRAYVANSGSNTLAVINTASNTVLSTIPAGVSPFGVALNRARNRAYVTGGSLGNVLTVVNLLTGGTEEAVTLGLDPKDPEYNPINDMIYVPSAL